MSQDNFSTEQDLRDSETLLAMQRDALSRVRFEPPLPEPKTYNQALARVDQAFQSVLKYALDHLAKHYKHVDLFADFIQVTALRATDQKWIVIYIKPEKMGFRLQHNSLPPGTRLPDYLVPYDAYLDIHEAVSELVEIDEEKAERWRQQFLPEGGIPQAKFYNRCGAHEYDPTLGIRELGEPWHKPQPKGLLTKLLSRMKWLLRR
jgi:hypothetical protein